MAVLIFPRVLLTVLLSITIAGTAVAAPKSPVVLFDAAHGERFLPQGEDPLALSDLGKLFVAEGFSLRSGNEPLTPAILAEVDAVVISGPFIPFAPEEIDALSTFVENGGHVSIMLHVAPVAGTLLARFDVIYSNGVIREEPLAQIDGEALNFQVTHLGKEPLLVGIDQFAVYGGWALAAEGKSARIVAKSGKKAWIDLNNDRILTHQDAMQPFGIIALGEMGRGDFVIFGDDAIFQNRFLTGGNLLLGKNLVQRLKP